MSDSLASETQLLGNALLEHPFLFTLRSGKFSRSFLKLLIAEQLGYNIKFFIAISMMRGQFLGYPEFVTDFLDPHLATELGANLESVGLQQSGITHIAGLYLPAAALKMEKEDLYHCGNAAQKFFEQALVGLIGGSNLSQALGAIYADEVFANVWFPSYLDGIKNHCIEAGIDLDLEFFESHANNIEPAHVEHASYLLRFCLTSGFDWNEFLNGYRGFYRLLVEKFDGLHSELLLASKV